MPTPFEAEIGSLLETHGNVPKVADELIMRWQKNLLNEAEQIDCAQFLLAAGLYPQLFSEIERLVKNAAKLPWAQFAEALGKTATVPERAELQALVEAAESQNSIPELLRSRHLDSLTPELGERRLELEIQWAKDSAERKQLLKDKLVYMRANRMFEQEFNVLEEFQAVFPEEIEVKEAKEAFKLRWARDVIANSGGQSGSQDDAAAALQRKLQSKAESLTEDQASHKNLVFKRALEIAKSDSQLAYDLAIALHMMDFNKEALEILNFAEESPASSWLRLELMIRARQFVSALDEANALELRYAGDPDSSFSVTYARARALHGLGQTETASELLKSIVRLRPHYKSAQSLLSEWDGSES